DPALGGNHRAIGFQAHRRLEPVKRDQPEPARERLALPLVGAQLHRRRRDLAQVDHPREFGRAHGKAIRAASRSSAEAASSAPAKPLSSAATLGGLPLSPSETLRFTAATSASSPGSLNASRSAPSRPPSEL